MRFGLTPGELAVLRRLDTPKKIQDFLETIPLNFEPGGDTCLSPRRVLRERRAHCIEGAMLAATALMVHGQPPLLLDLEAAKEDFDHVVALFRKGGRWGAISKTNHAVLRYREPVYASVRELALSYFHEYFDAKGRKTLRTYSRPFDLRRLGEAWITAEEDVWEVPNALCETPHVRILTPSQIAGLRRADPVELRAGEIVQFRTRTRGRRT
ncbi:MAG TPA: hypothetical protein VMU11_04585 [Verrucomicrobiae bacterium]|nr:hypothetical protein [Verrucomicrobiae bacterium]